MCGIAGLLDAERSDQELEEILRRMCATMKHRGPDAQSQWISATRPGPAFGHTRLAIVDLSPAGLQPMRSSQGQYVLTYNGEIYNHQELRRKLERETGPIEWRGHSDTETLLACIERYGVEETLPLLNGMFAFGLWDAGRKRLTLARDRFGEKPLYYWNVGPRVVFGSQISVLAQHPSWLGRIDRGVLAQFLRYNCVQAPYSIYEGVRQLPPGHYLHIDGITGDLAPALSYWNIAKNFVAGASDRFSKPAEELIGELEALLMDSVGARMMSDVPLGAFLSGGIDSSTIVALMQAQSSRPVRTFSIGMPSLGYDEAQQAKAVAKHLGTDHTELYVTPADALAVVPDLPRLWDEPFADASQIPTFLVSKLARQSVTVSLSGDAGDELFAGYNRYVDGYDVWSRLNRLPSGARTLLAKVFHAMPVDALTVLMSKLGATRNMPALHSKFSKLARVLEQSEPNAFFLTLVSQFIDPEELVLGAREAPSIARDPTLWPDGVEDFREMMMFLDTVGYLPNDILTKVDRASMGVSLESRVPFLDPRVAEFAWRLPLDMKLRNGKSKWILRQVLYRHVPEKLVDRPKMGFGIPIEHWLHKELADWVEDLLEPGQMSAEGLFDVPKIQKLWDEHKKGRAKNHYQLWSILMFQSWYRFHEADRVAA